ncbi:MAG: hypothetical protein MJ070_04890 [Lachnospiraceae bacterium]|nr:hypothetical protein [Lachnospiraceae bacterium]
MKFGSGGFAFVRKNLFGMILWGVFFRLVLRFSLSVPSLLADLFRLPAPGDVIGSGLTALTAFLFLPPLFTGGMRYFAGRGPDGKSDITLLLSGFSSFERWSDAVLDGLPLAFLGAVCYTSARLLFTLAGLYTGKTAAILFVFALLGTVFTFFLFASGIAVLLGADTRSAAFAVIGKSVLHLTLWAVLYPFPLLFILFSPLYPLSLAGIKTTSVSPVEIQIEGDST